MKRLCSLLVFCIPLAGAGNTYGKLPLSFEPNQGQTDARVKFLARAPGYTLFLTADQAVIAGRDGSVERMKLIGAEPKARFEPLDKQPGISNYFIGNDPAKWRTNIPNYGRVAIREVYPGIDLVFYGNPRELECDWVVAPGANPKQIRVKWEGAERISKNASGDLVLSGSLRQKKPVILQGGKPIQGGYVIRGKEVGFAVAKHDATKPLLIDPVMIYATYLGSSGDDVGFSIAVDGAGNAYVTGYTRSTDFPTTNPLQATSGGGFSDAFVTKINAAGSAKVYSTYLGGSSEDVGYGIAVDSLGNAYVTGYTVSTNFPTTNPLQASYGGGQDAFVTKINSLGSTLLYSTYLGGSGDEGSSGIAVDGSGYAYVSGWTDSTNFPTSNPLQAANGGGQDAFVTKINSLGSTLLYSTYLGGSQADYSGGIAVDGSGNVYVTGYTLSTNFPTTNPLQARDGDYDAFVTKINAAGSALVYSTFLGGSGADVGYGIAIDSLGNAYVTGYTLSTNFPTTNPLQARDGDYDAFVTKINAAGSALVYSTFLGGSGADVGYGIAVDSLGNAYVTGYTVSTNFPTTNPLQASYGGGQDAFVTKINSLGSTLLYSTYLGGSGDEGSSGIAVDGAGNAYVTGSTISSDFPTANPLQPSNGGSNDAFVLLISGNAPTAAFRDSSGAIELTSPLSPSLKNSGGTFASDPAIAQDAAGNTYVVACDNFNAVWLNFYNSQSQNWQGWQLAGGNIAGTPSVTAETTRAYIAARDSGGAYWFLIYTPGSGFGAWTSLGGAFVTDPVIATLPGPSFGVHIVGRDNSNAIWANLRAGASFGGWHLGGAAAQGKPAATLGQDGAAYIAIRDPSNSIWMGRFNNASTWSPWQPGGGAMAADPQVASVGNDIRVAALASSGAVWQNAFVQGTGNNWLGWASVGGVFQNVTVAAGSAPQFFLAAKDTNNALWWYESTTAQWSYLGAPGIPAGPLSAAPR